MQVKDKIWLLKIDSIKCEVIQKQIKILKETEKTITVAFDCYTHRILKKNLGKIKFGELLTFDLKEGQNTIIRKLAFDLGKYKKYAEETQKLLNYMGVNLCK